jgi:hypothetical protein
MGNLNSVKEHLYSAIESSNKDKVVHILKVKKLLKKKSEDFI